MANEAPVRDITIVEEDEAETKQVVAPSAPAPAPAKKTKDWKNFKGVIESTKIDTIDRLDIVAGVNEYKGNHYVFIAKVTDANFQRAFFNIPAYAWAKAMPILNKYVASIGDIEKKAMAQAVVDELKRLKELGIDVKGLVEQI